MLCMNSWKVIFLYPPVFSEKTASSTSSWKSVPAPAGMKPPSLLPISIACTPVMLKLKSGKLKIDKAKVQRDEKLDGKYLLSSSDESLSAEDIARGYKQLLEVERAFRTLKSTLCLRPVYHSKDERIRSHVVLCWLALLLVRIAEVETGLTWPKIKREMQRLHLGEFLTKKARILQHTELTSNQQNILKPLKINPPKRILNIDFMA